MVETKSATSLGLFGKKFNKHGQNGVTIRASCDSLLEMQDVDEHKMSKQLSISTELNFVDSYKYNIAAYRLAELLGMEDMLPVYVERKWQGNSGSLSWWLPVQMDEKTRLERKVQAPDPDA